ncbi:hypothetical protein ACVP6W_003221 [Vibrio cholerae]|nr:hypothetical protein [Vibrio cholerae]
MKPVIEINSAPFVLPNDPLAALEEIASYLSAINYQKSHAVIANEDGEEPYLNGVLAQSRSFRGESSKWFLLFSLLQRL